MDCSIQFWHLFLPCYLCHTSRCLVKLFLGSMWRMTEIGSKMLDTVDWIDLFWLTLSIFLKENLKVAVSVHSNKRSSKSIFISSFSFFSGGKDSHTYREDVIGVWEWILSSSVIRQSDASSLSPKRRRWKSPCSCPHRISLQLWTQDCRPPCGATHRCDIGEEDAAKVCTNIW